MRFLGIPFAASPVGSLRFQAAQPYNGSYANVNATVYGPPCIQSPSVFGVTNTTPTSEDCLSLNIYTTILPSSTNTSGQLLPVAFWIYGGAFQEGAGSIPDYDGGNMASRGGVVVVTINYRLGLLGNLASSTLAGSQGITDQIQALKWVQQHISTFGGDPTKVTIFGQSAGGQSVISLLSSTAAKGLFSAAISESAPWNPFLSRSVYAGPAGIYPALLNATNCTQSDANAQLSCLQAVPAANYLSAAVLTPVTAASVVAQKAYSQVGPLTSEVEPVLPVIGTGVVDGLFKNLVRNGTLPSAGIPLLIGNMENEGTLFVDSVPQLASPVPYSEVVVDYLIQNSFDNATINVILANLTLFGPNATDPDELRDFASQLVTLDTWQCPLQQILGYAYSQKTFSSLYTYRFDKGVAQVPISGLPSACFAGAPSGVQSICHSADIPEVFGTSNVDGYPYSVNNSLIFTQYVMDVWTAFIRTGNPQPDLGYLAARGRGYNDTLAFAQAVPFNAFNPNSTSAIQIMDQPPRSTSLLFQAQCAALSSVGFPYDRVTS